MPAPRAIFLAGFQHKVMTESDDFLDPIEPFAKLTDGQGTITAVSDAIPILYNTIDSFAFVFYYKISDLLTPLFIESTVQANNVLAMRVSMP